MRGRPATPPAPGLDPGGDGKGGLAGHGQPAGLGVDGLDGDVVDDLDGVAAQLLAEQLAQLQVDGGHDRWGLLNQVTSRPRAQKASAISRPM